MEDEDEMIGMARYTIMRFKTKRAAMLEKKKFKKTYGYYPGLFHSGRGKKATYEIVKPSGLKKITAGRRIARQIVRKKFRPRRRPILF